jgi:hypothetical protein
MKSLISLICTILLAIQVSGQSGASLSALKAVTIRLRRPDAPKTFPGACFSHFEVLDERPDTTRIGIHTNIPDFGRNHERQLIFSQPAASEIAGYLNKHFARPGAPYTALIILRTLWLSDAKYIREDLIRDPDRRFDRTHIHLKAELYAIRDGRYLPILRFDTTQTAQKKPLYQERSTYYEWGRNLGALVSQFADSAFQVAGWRLDQGNWIGLEEIRQFNSVRFNAPIGGDGSLTRGVYTCFNEFRNNAPSIADFEVRLGDNQRFLYLRESGKSYYSHDAWGYCDGKNIYIMRDGELCPAWKEGQAFYFYRDLRKPRKTNHYYAQTEIPPSAAATGPSPGAMPPPAAIIPSPSGTMPPSRIVPSPAAVMPPPPSAHLIAMNIDADYRGRSIYSVDMDTGDIY